jgi:hypothetical protein
VVLGRELKLGGNAKWHVEEGLIFDLFDNQAIVPVLVK